MFSGSICIDVDATVHDDHLILYTISNGINYIPLRALGVTPRVYQGKAVQFSHLILVNYLCNFHSNNQYHYISKSTS